VRSEAVYLDAVTDDGRSGAVLRLCRHPQEGFAWLWGHVFLNGSVYAFTRHDAPCTAALTSIDAARVAYRSEGDWSALEFEREGVVDAVSRVEAGATLALHESRHAPHGPGPIAATVTATFMPRMPAVSNLPGRNEVVGEADVRIVLGRHAFELRGRGQFHEQVQTEPRFTTPFVYGTLRGRDFATVFVRTSSVARGHWLEANRATRVDRVEISPPGSRRALVLHTTAGVLSGTLETTYEYTIPIGRGCRPGTLVVGEIGGKPVSGCVNDFLVDSLDYERI
jgi:hypothetical protein